jgi:hypothetical protein
VSWLIVGVGAVVLLLVLTFASTRRRDLVRLDFSGDELTITPKGLNKLWALRRTLTVPVSSITSARVLSGALRDLPLGLRLPGTAIPGIVLAGTYLKRGERSLYVLRDARDMVLLELEGQRFRRVGFQIDDPYSVVNAIRARMGEVPPEGA